MLFWNNIINVIACGPSFSLLSSLILIWLYTCYKTYQNLKTRVFLLQNFHSFYLKKETIFCSKSTLCTKNLSQLRLSWEYPVYNQQLKNDHDYY